METFFSYYLISLGLGQFASIAFSKEDHYRAFGINTFLGFSLIPILLFVLNLIFKLPLNVSAYIVILISIPGLVLFLLKIKKHGLAVLNHPLFLLVVPILTVFSAASQGYYPFSWDEFSHWATMPKQIFLHKEITSDDFLIKNFAAYTPGWPLIVVFKDLIFSKTLQYGHFLFLPLLSALLMLSSLFDAVLLSVKKTEGFALGWIVILLAIFLGIPTGYFSETNLIEFPMIHGLCFIFILCGLHFNSAMREVENFIRIGIALAYCYLLKHTFMTMLPIVLLFYLVYVLKASSKFSKKNTLLLIYLIVPYLIAFSIWQWNLGMHDLVQGYSPVNNTLDSALKNAFSKLGIILPSLKRFLLLFVKGKVPAVVFMLLFPFSMLISNKLRPVGKLIITYLFFYYACLMWMYLTVFSIGDATELASFERFMSIPLAPMTLYSLAIITPWVLTKVPNGLSNILLNHKMKFLFVSILFLSAIFYRKIHRTPKAKNEIAREASSLVKLIQEKNLKQPKVLIVAQGGNRFEFHVANLESIGGDSYYYSVMYGTSWGEDNDNQWRILTSKSDMMKLITEADILWVYKSDKWMDINLKNLNVTNNCDKSFDNYFIINNGNGTFTCTEKSI